MLQRGAYDFFLEPFEPVFALITAAASAPLNAASRILFCDSFLMRRSLSLPSMPGS